MLALTMGNDYTTPSGYIINEFIGNKRMVGSISCTRIYNYEILHRNLSMRIKGWEKHTPIGINGLAINGRTTRWRKRGNK